MIPAWVYSKTPAPSNTPQIEDKPVLLLWFLVCYLPHISLLGVSPPVQAQEHAWQLGPVYCRLCLKSLLGPLAYMCSVHTELSPLLKVFKSRIYLMF